MLCYECHTNIFFHYALTWSLTFLCFLSLAILFECVHTVYSIYPKSELLEKAAKCIGKFVLSPKINLKYLGKMIGSFHKNYKESFWNLLGICCKSLHIMRFLLLGLKALTYVIQQDPTLALQHQMTIIECLDHPDPIIKREVNWYFELIRWKYYNFKTFCYHYGEKLKWWAVCVCVF